MSEKYFSLPLSFNAFCLSGKGGTVMIREEIIAQKVKGKRVLDIGSVGQSDEYCLWDILSESSSELTGVDLPTSIDTLKK